MALIDHFGPEHTSPSTGQVPCAAAERFADFRLMSEDKGLPDPGSSWAWLGLGSALDGISGVTREATLSDKPHVVYGPQKKKNEHPG